MTFRRWSLVSSAAIAFGWLAAAAAGQNPPPAPVPAASASTPVLPLWAYPVNPGRGGRGPGAPGAPGGAAPNAGVPAGAATGAPPAGAPAGGGAGRGPGRAPDDGSLKHVPGSTQGYTATYIADLFSVPDWFPDSHPAMPDVVAHGNRASMVQACGYCHLPTGQGRPENESVAGLPAGYILQEIADFKNDLRKSSEPRMGSVAFMVRIGKNVSEDDAKAAAAYFASLKPKPWIRVVETDTVPVTRPMGGMLVAVDGGGSEPIGERVIEVSENQGLTELRDTNSGFIAYVPKGSLARGKDLVMTGGNGKTVRCTICHGSDLKGMAGIPPIIGRSPSQMTRQIIDIQTGARNGPYDQLMKEPVRQLTNDDIVAIASYLASLQP